MASTTSLLNRALRRIGAGRINSIDDDTDVGQLIRDTFPDVRQALLRSHPWPFASFRSRLARDVAESDIGYRYAYRKPEANDQHGEWLRTLGIFTDDAMRCPALRYRDANDLILSDETALVMWALHDIEDPNAMEANFREALAMKCAAEWALALSNSKSLHDTHMALAEQALARARGIAAMDGPPEPVPIGSWETSRHRGSWIA